MAWLDLPSAAVGKGILAAVLGAALLLSCESAGRFDDLPRRERDRFARCWSRVREAMDCGLDTRGLLNTACEDRGKRRFAARESESARRAWLVLNGCPPTMVGVEHH